MEKNGTPDSPATARAKSVLPVPGGPARRTPRGTFPPRRWKRSGSLRNCTISWRSDFAAFSPAMSSKVWLTEVALSNLRLWFFPKAPRTPPLPNIPVARLDIQSHTPMISAQGKSVTSTWTPKGCL